MTDLAKRDATTARSIEQVLAAGDLSKLSPEERTRLYLGTCESLGLNPLTRPFEYLNLKGKLVLYARKDATDQIRNLRRVSIESTSWETRGDICIVSARARMPDGRTDEEIGAVAIKGLAGVELADAYMRAITKAKRRVTLSICGLGMLDETEVETIRGARPANVDEDGVIHDDPPEKGLAAPDPDEPAVVGYFADGEAASESRVAAPAERGGRLWTSAMQLDDMCRQQGVTIEPLLPDWDDARLRGWLDRSKVALQQHAARAARAREPAR